MEGLKEKFFIPCGCADGSLYVETSDCPYCKSTGRLLTQLGMDLMELILYHETQKNFDRKKSLRQEE